MYVLAQLEAAFYTQVILRRFNGMTDLERDYLENIRDHEIAHREFFKNLLGGAAIAALEFDFTIDRFFQAHIPVIIPPLS